VDRKLVAAAAGLGGVVVLVVVLVLLLGSCWSQPAGTSGGATPDPGASAAPAATTEATDVPTSRPTETAASGSDGSPDPGEAATGPDVVIRYQVQEGEALLAIADEFGITRRRLQRMNEGLEEIPPAELPGTEILVPVPASMTVEELEALPGYLGMADEA
jgi:chemotaxis protein histidine kinase CheA